MSLVTIFDFLSIYNNITKRNIFLESKGLTCSQSYSTHNKDNSKWQYVIKRKVEVEGSLIIATKFLRWIECMPCEVSYCGSIFYYCECSLENLDKFITN